VPQPSIGWGIAVLGYFHKWLEDEENKIFNRSGKSNGYAYVFDDCILLIRNDLRFLW